MKPFVRGTPSVNRSRIEHALIPRESATEVYEGVLGSQFPFKKFLTNHTRLEKSMDGPQLNDFLNSERISRNIKVRGEHTKKIVTQNREIARLEKWLEE